MASFSCLRARAAACRRKPEESASERGAAGRAGARASQSRVALGGGRACRARGALAGFGVFTCAVGRRHTALSRHAAEHAEDGRSVLQGRRSAPITRGFVGMRVLSKAALRLWALPRGTCMPPRLGHAGRLPSLCRRTLLPYFFDCGVVPNPFRYLTTDLVFCP